MTQEQYDKYTEIYEELKALKNFLFWCGERHKDRRVGKYQFSIKTLSKGFAFLRREYLGSERENTYYISKELQNRLIETIEDYVDEKQKALQYI